MEFLKNHHERLVLGIALLLFPLFLFNAPGTHDVLMWFGWSQSIVQHGLLEGYAQSNSFYPPLFFVAMTILMGAAYLTGISGLYIFKISLLACILITCWQVWRWTQNRIVVLMLYFSLVFSCIYMVYMDAWIAPLLAGALYALVKRHYITFSVLYSLACLLKWQPAILAPVIGVYMLGIGMENRFDRKAWCQLLLHCLGPAAVITTAILGLFGFGVVFHKLSEALNEGIFSAQAMNLGWVITYGLHVVSPDIYGPLQHSGNDMINGMPKIPSIFLKIMFASVYIVTLVFFYQRKKSEENFLCCLLTVYFAYYILNTGVHENHLFIGAVLSLILAGHHEKYLPAAIVLNLMNMINMLMFYHFYSDNFFKLGQMTMGLDITLVVSAFNTLFFFYFWARMLTARTG